MHPHRPLRGCWRLVCLEECGRLFDVDAFALLVRLEDEHGQPVVTNVRQSSSGHVWLDLPDGDVDSGFASPHSRLISAVHVAGGAAPEYLEATLQTETYHRPGYYLGWQDLLSFQLPPDLLPGKYALRALSHATSTSTNPTAACRPC